jgi:Mrp family chromosome partitioning ATPase
MIVSIGAVLAVGLALALALLRENVVGGFVSETQLGNVLRLRSTASLDRHRDTPRVDHPADLMIEAPLSPYAEAVRRIELVANQALRRQPRRENRGDVVLITSVQAGEGKSTLALALARAHALAGRTALLIDCNLRQPALATLTGVRREFGLREYLDAPEGDVQLAGLLAPDPLSQARLALGVTPSTGPTDHLLGGAALARMIDAARRSFDVVILDASPVTTVVDPLYLVAHADAVLLLVRYAETSQSHARAALSALYAARPDGVEVVGVLARAEG